MTNTTLTRMPDYAVTDRAELDRLLDDTVLAHIGMVDDTGSAVVIPTGIARDGDRILVHGSTGLGWMRRVAEGGQVCVTVTDLNGIIVARSSFESSFRYRSAVLFGTFTRLSDPDLSQALDVIIEHFLPGRRAEIRATSRRELAATIVLAMPIQDWSLKISGAWPTDPADDVAGSTWAASSRSMSSTATRSPLPTCARASRSPRRSAPSPTRSAERGSRHVPTRPVPSVKARPFRYRGS